MLHASAQIWVWNWDRLFQALNPALSCPGKIGRNSFKEYIGVGAASHASWPLIFHLSKYHRAGFDSLSAKDNEKSSLPAKNPCRQTPFSVFYPTLSRPDLQIKGGNGGLMDWLARDHLRWLCGLAG